MTVESQARMLRDLAERVERGLARSNVQPASVVDVDLAHTSDGVSTPVRVEFRAGDSARSIWLPAANGVVPAVGEPVTILFNGSDAIIVPRPGTVIEGGWQSSNFPGFGLGGPGWGLSYDGNIEGNDIVGRGIFNASGGGQLLENGDFEVDISGWTESAGTLSHETDTGETHGVSAGALKLVTASESTERFVESSIVDIDPNHPLYRLDGFVRGSHAVNRAKAAIVWRGSDDTLIDESVGEYVSVGTAYDRVVAQESPPRVETGFTDFQPNEDVAFVGTSATGSPNNTADQRYQNVDEIALDTTDYVQADTDGVLQHRWRANVGSGAFAGKTINAVEVLVDAAHTGGGVLGSLTISIVGVVSSQASFDIQSTITRHAIRWDMNPATGLPWTVAEVEAFDTTSTIQCVLLEPESARRMYRYTLRVHWQEDIPAPSRASVRVYLDPEQSAVTTWRVDDVVLRKESSGTFPALKSAESGRRWELDNVDQPELRLLDDDGNDIATIGRRTGVALERATNTNITTLATIGVSWQTEGHQEPDGYWTSGANVVIPAGMDGLYAVNFSCIFTGAAATLLWPSFSVRNSFGSTVPTLEQFSSFSGSRGWAFTEWLEAGDTFSCLVHNSGGTTITLDLAHLQLHRVVSG